MNRRAHWALTLAASAVAAAASYLLPGAGAGIALANGVTYGGFAWLAIDHADLLLHGGHPWSVARWSGVIGGLSVLAAATVLTAGLPSAPPGERVAIAALAFGTTWAGVGLGATLARAHVAAEEERRVLQDPWEP